MAHYKLAEFKDALSAFQAAYAADPSPNLLFNIAQTYWKLNELEQAIAFYQRYLQEAPEATNRPSVEIRIEHLQVQLSEPASAEQINEAARRALLQGQSTGSQTQAVVASAEPQESASWPSQKYWGLGLGVAGGVGIVAGGILGVMALNRSTDADPLCNANNVCLGKGASYRRQAQGLGTASAISLAAGAVGLGLGALLFFGAEEEPEPAAAALAHGPWAGAAGWGWQAVGRW